MNMLDHFAERLSQHDLRKGDRGGSVALSARRLGKSESWGKAQLKQLEDKYGWQAA